MNITCITFLMYTIPPLHDNGVSPSNESIIARDNTSSQQKQQIENQAIATSGSAQSAIALEKEFFWKVTPAILKEAYKQKKITAEFYIEGIIKCNKPGFVITTTVTAFCKEWEIPRRTFYRIISQLRAEGIIFWETDPNAPMMLWHGTEFPYNSSPPKGKNTHANGRVEIPVPSVAQPVPSVAQPVPSVAQPVPSVAQSTPENQSPQAFQTPYRELTDNKQINTDSAPGFATRAPHPGQLGNFSISVSTSPSEDGSKSQPAQRVSTHNQVFQVDNLAVNQSQDYESNETATHEDQSSGGWQCPDPKLKREFMSWLTRNANGIQSARHAANWCNKYSENAYLAWDDFLAARKRAADKSASFASWDSRLHSAYYERLLSEGLEKFRTHDISAQWYEWAIAKHPDRFVDIPA